MMWMLRQAKTNGERGKNPKKIFLTPLHGSYEIDTNFEKFLRGNRSQHRFLQCVLKWEKLEKLFSVGSFGEITKFVFLALNNLT